MPGRIRLGSILFSTEGVVSALCGHLLSFTVRGLVRNVANMHLVLDVRVTALLTIGNVLSVLLILLIVLIVLALYFLSHP